jgi:hypothetical protein
MQPSQILANRAAVRAIYVARAAAYQPLPGRG